MTPDVTYVHAATLTEDSYQRIAATGGTASVSTESEQSAGQGYPPTWELRKHGIPVSLSMDTSVWWSADLFSAMRATLSADRSREHLEAHAPRRDRGAQQAAGRGGRALGDHRRRDARSGWPTRSARVTPGKRADLVLIKNDNSPAMYPILHPYGSVVFQAGRGDVHTVLVDGQVVKHEHALVGVDLPRRATPSAHGRLRPLHDGRAGLAGQPDAGAAAGRPDPESVHLHRLRGRGVAAPRPQTPIPTT